MPGETRWQRSASLEMECEALPAPCAPKGRAPAVTLTCPAGTELSGIRAALEGGALPRFLESDFGSHNVTTTPWTSHSTAEEGAKKIRVQRMAFSMPVPRDLPDIVCRLVSVPDTVVGSTLNSFCCGEEELVLMQR